MVMKNKLNKHHKSKFYFIARNFAIAFSSCLALTLVVTLPTYISISAGGNIESQAVTEVDKKNDVETSTNEDEEENNEIVYDTNN